MIRRRLWGFPDRGHRGSLNGSPSSLKKAKPLPPAPEWQSMQPLTLPARRMPSLLATLPSGLYLVQ